MLIFRPCTEQCSIRAALKVATFTECERMKKKKIAFKSFPYNSLLDNPTCQN